jgi:Hydrogenase maturation factor
MTKKFIEDKMEGTIKGIMEGTLKNTIKGAIKNTIEDTIKDTIESTIKDTIEDTIKDGSQNQELYDQAAFQKAVEVLLNGGILAVKGIGGYHLVCSPFLEETVNKLRKLKGREEKPFAVMFPSLSEIEAYCRVSEEEKALLLSRARPIVLLYEKQQKMAPSANKGSIYCGAFLPYTPLQIMLTKKCGPLIMTSANLSNQPIVREDEDILKVQSSELMGVLYNQRRIVRSVDDSVARIIDGKPQLIRRSRGYVPYPVFLPMTCNTAQHLQNVIPFQDTENNLNLINYLPNGSSDNTQERDCSYSEKNMIFAAGGDLKAAFCLSQNGNAVVSQYFGDLEEASVMGEYEKSYHDLTRLLRMKPELAVCDLHPNYHSSHFAKALGIPLLQVQHHHAHIASVMAEHDLKERVIGIAFDGTGYGYDKTIWGGEFLICEGMNFIRAACLSPVPMLGGDQSMRDAKKTATCYLLQAGLDTFVKDERSAMIQSALRNKINTVLTSSMGRLFDAVASVLNIGHINRYEGECAALLEKEAVLAQQNHLEPAKLSFAIEEKNEIIELNPGQVFRSLCMLRDKAVTGSLAFGFHLALAQAVGEVCERLRTRFNSNTVALGGGVFQNVVLTEQILKLLREKGFQVYMNSSVPPNDGGISLGQTYIGNQYIERYHVEHFR